MEEAFLLDEDADDFLELENLLLLFEFVDDVTLVLFDEDFEFDETVDFLLELEDCADFLDEEAFDEEVTFLLLLDDMLYSFSLSDDRIEVELTAVERGADEAALRFIFEVEADASLVVFDF